MESCFPYDLWKTWKIVCSVDELMENTVSTNSVEFIFLNRTWNPVFHILICGKRGKLVSFLLDKLMESTISTNYVEFNFS